jgi:hypothetical protein
MITILILGCSLTMLILSCLDLDGVWFLIISSIMSFIISIFIVFIVSFLVNIFSETYETKTYDFIINKTVNAERSTPHVTIYRYSIKYKNENYPITYFRNRTEVTLSEENKIIEFKKPLNKLWLIPINKINKIEIKATKDNYTIIAQHLLN